jgi:polyferredoxin
MRLDHFLNFPNASRRAQQSLQRAAPYRWARKMLPNFLFSTGRRVGLVRKGLKEVGESWHSSPLRRLIQTACFILFCVLFFYTSWPYTAAPVADVSHGSSHWPSHYADDFSAKEVVEAETFLALDPLVGISTAIAARAWIWSLVWAGIILGVGILIPRGFCGYVCPLGTLIDLFDWAIGKRVKRFRVKSRGGWIHLKYYLLAGTLVAALAGVLVSGYVAAIPVVTRGFTFVLAPLQLGFAKGWYQVPPMNAGHIVSILLFVGVLALGLMRPRFWCRYVCPTGAIFSVSNLFARASERKVETSCIDCGKCVEVCPFDAIKPDFTTRTMDCTLCQTCGGVCPTHAIKFVERWNGVNLKGADADGEIPLARRGFLVGAAGGLAAFFGVGLSSATEKESVPVRPPMSVPEEAFLDMCICHRTNVKSKKILQETAVVVYAGPGKEDRILEGTYTELRQQEQHKRQTDRQKKLDEQGDFY